jgi:hypothetical protein
MIPKTYPSTENSGVQCVTVFQVTPLVTDIPFGNYVPVKAVVPAADKRNTYDTDGAIAATVLASATGLIPFVDYIPVQNFVAGTVPWTTDANGFIPLELLSGVLV